MEPVPLPRAIALLRSTIQRMDADDLREVYKEMFPAVDGGRDTHGAELLDPILHHLDEGLEVEELLDLWNVAFPDHPRVFFDEESGSICFDEESGALEPVE